MKGFVGIDDGFVEFELEDGVILPSADEGAKFSFDAIITVEFDLVGVVVVMEGCL